MTPRELIESFEVVAEAPDGVKRLRELVLQLAVRGKLVPQDPGDEPAGILLERIAAEKARFCGRRSPPSRSEDALLPFAVPPSWATTTFGSACQKLGAGSTPLGGSKVYLPTGVKFIRSQNVWNDGLRLDDVAHVSAETHRKMAETTVRPRDVLLNITGASIGRSAYVPPGFDEANVSQHVAIIRPAVADTAPWIHLFLTSPVAFRAIMDVQVGISREGLSMARLKGFALPLPPLAEQHRIVARVDELMGLLDRLEAAREDRDATRDAARDSALAALRNADTPDEVEVAWNRIAERMAALFTRPADLEPLRQAVLQLAVRGRLVRQNPSDEPASVLLERIAAARKAVLDAKLTRMGDDVGGFEERADPPSGWLWIALQDAVQFIDYRGNTPPKTDSGVRLITAKNIRDGFIADEPREFVSAETYTEWMTRGFPKKGDVLFTTEAPLGMAALVDLDERFALAQRAINLHPYADLDGRYLMWLILSPWFQQRIGDRATGMTASGIKAAKLRLIQIPLPPLAEQHRIVAKVDALMALIDQLEARLTAATDLHAQFAAAAVHHLDA